MKANSNRIYSSPPRCLEATKKESGWRVFRRVMTLAVAGAVLCLSANLAAQQLGVDVTSAQQESGTDLGNYHTNFDIEAGYRFVGTEGNASMYSTWVNMQQGPRILSSDLSMRSLNHDGFLFDRLNMSSFGYGGDPETATRLTVSKDKWYDFNFTYRHDLNYWDYNVLANPLNPVNPYVVVNQSPHLMQPSRDFQNYDLTIMPESRLRFRAGYNYNGSQGQTDTTFHAGTDILLVQPWRVTGQTYRFGADYRIFSQTTISYDQTFDTFKNDTFQVDQNQMFSLQNGTPVDIGLPFNPAAGLPCSTPFINGSYNPKCNGDFSYVRSGPVRSFLPTEQISLHSSFLKRVDLTARYAYSSGYSQVTNYLEEFNGLESRTNQREFAFTGPSNTKRVLDDGDFEGTWHITNKLAFSEAFRFYNSRSPGTLDSVGTSCFPNGGTSLLSGIGVFNSPGVSPQICLNGSGTPVHTGSSPADVDYVNYYRYLNLNFKYNTADLEYTLNRRVGGHIGYRYADKQANSNNNLSNTDAGTAYFYPNDAQRGAPCTQTLADGTCVVMTPVVTAVDYYAITENWGFLGVWVRPMDTLRLNGDVEIMAANGAGGVLFTRIEPRNLQHYKLRGRYTPKKWLAVSGTLNWIESQNTGPDTDGTITANHHDHNHYAGFEISMTPRELISFDLGYVYNEVVSTTDVCVNLGTPSLAADPCYADSNGANTFAIWHYQNTVNSVYFNVILRPTKRTAFAAGYYLVDSTGSDPLFLPTTGIVTVANPLQPLGSLSSLYHTPSASLAFALAKGWEAKGMWNYYDYHERGNPGPILPRDFHSNTGTIAVRYAF